MAGAIADAVAGAIERRQRHQHDIGDDFGRGGDGSGMPSGPSTSRSPGDQARNASDLPRAMIAGSASLAPVPGELPHQRHGIDLAADRRIAGDDRARRDLERQPALGDRLRRGGALLVAQRIAPASAAARSSAFDGLPSCNVCSAVITRESG